MWKRTLSASMISFWMQALQVMVARRIKLVKKTSIATHLVWVEVELSRQEIVKIKKIMAQIMQATRMLDQRVRRKCLSNKTFRFH